MKEALHDSHLDVIPAVYQLLGLQLESVSVFPKQLKKKVLCTSQKMLMSGPLCLYSGTDRHIVTFAPIYMVGRGRKLTWEVESISWRGVCLQYASRI